MPDRRTHRGAHPEDADAFAPEALPVLREAVSDYSWLLGRDYADRSALKVVGDRYSLTERQRLAVMRCACPDAARTARAASQVGLDAIQDRPLMIDGYNVLTTIEAALAGGVILEARDGCYRDLASMHGTFRQVEETTPALLLIGQTLERAGPAACAWLLDSPVSNSGRLAGRMREMAAERGWPWTVEMVTSPDHVLTHTDQIVATADSVVLDRCRQWVNLARAVVSQHVPCARIVPLG